MPTEEIDTCSYEDCGGTPSVAIYATHPAIPLPAKFLACELHAPLFREGEPFRVKEGDIVTVEVFGNNAVASWVGPIEALG